jgi:RimJ/RimL family protein N-acetyltransferase
MNNMIELSDLEQRNIDVLVKLLNNKNVTKYLTSRIPQPYTTEDAEWWINTGSKTGITNAIQVDGYFAGVINVTAGEYENFRSAEIGYWLGEDYWGKGIATEAVEKMTNYVFSSTEIVRLFAPVFSPNIKSMRVLEKNGYIKEGIFKKSIFKSGEYFDEHLFAKVHS